LSDKGWLIAGCMNRGIWHDFKAFVARTPIAARNHARLQTLAPKIFDQRHYQRRFPRAASHDIANHDDRNAEVFGRQKSTLVQRPAQPHQQTVYLRHWPEQTRQRAARAPGFEQELFHAVGL
jgi:hypothetical protein